MPRFEYVPCCPIKNIIVDLPIKTKGNSKCTSGNSLSLLGTQNKDISAASQTLLTGGEIMSTMQAKVCLLLTKYYLRTIYTCYYIEYKTFYQLYKTKQSNQ